MTDSGESWRHSLLRFRPPPLLRLLFFALLSVVMLRTQLLHDHLAPVRSALLTLVYPLQVAVRLPASGYQWAADTFSARHRLIEENAHLQVQQALLKAQLQRFSSLELENQDLRELLRASSHVQEKALVAQLVAVDMSPFSHHITIDKGTANGIFSGQPVLDTNGVVGQVHHVSPISSTVILVTNPDHALPVQVNRTGLRGVLMGSGPGSRLSLAYIPNSADVEVGDQLVTSGLGGRFPAGFPAGQVVAVDQDPRKPFARIDVEPSAHPQRSRHFILIWPAATSPRLAEEADAPAAPMATEVATAP